MSTSKIIQKEFLTAYERWELPEVGTPIKPTSEEVDPASIPNMLSAEELEEIRQAGYQEGLEQGRREGLQSGKQEAQARVQRLSQILTALTEPLREVDEQVEQELTQLAMATARQLIWRELKTDPSLIVAVVKEAITLLPANSRRVQISLHPDDASLIREHVALSDSEDRRWRLVEDASLTRGGCKIATEHSRIDATVESRIAAAIERALGGEQEDDGNH